MSEHRGRMDPVSVGLVAALAALVVAAGGLALGPGRSLGARASAELADWRGRLERWQHDERGHRAPGASERNGWLARWRGLVQRVEPVRGDAELAAVLARVLDGPSVRDVEVVRLEPSDGGDPGERTTEVLSPVDGAELRIERVPVQLRFRSSWEDAARIVERLERRVVATNVDALDMERDPPGVAVRLDLTLFVRRPAKEAA